ncbi:hypothetical protein FVE85_7126 [Porphyridium purpureum]|uniref:MARVEL domain-containing protein n=1 Tax=Porphyridium purpureum TaxID=35688 RepID=A0A5J4Z6P1_PORPP|nr:hypothetical protein FVE85_7126 [Porphyridium purpureum]|eukprot:POR7059..scf295_1
MGKGAGKGGGCAGILAAIVSLLEWGVAIAVMVLVGEYMYQERVNGVYYACLLDGRDGTANESICEYAFALGAFSILASFIVFLVQCATCCCGKIPNIIGTVFQGMGTIWWLAGAIVIAVYAVPAQGDFPRDSERAAIISLNFGNFVLFLVGTIASAKEVGD